MPAYSPASAAAALALPAGRLSPALVEDENADEATGPSPSGLSPSGLSPSGRPASTSPSPPPPWTLRGDSTTTGNSRSNNSSSPTAPRFSVSRAGSVRSNGSSSGGGPRGGGRSVGGSRSVAGGGGGRRRNSTRASLRSRSSRASSVAEWRRRAAGAARWAGATGRHVVAFYGRLRPLQRVAFVGVAAAAVTVGVLALVYSHRVFAALGPVARGWHDLPGGWLLVWLLVFVTGFPPVIGYSTACTLAGLVYGFPWGWPIAASANVAGSLAAFVASRGVFSRYVHRLVGTDHRFVALGHVLRHDGLWVLAAVRFCPLPYSLSNGFLSTIPSISPAAFALSTAMASPKLLVHVYIGSRLAALAEDGDNMSAGSKALNYVSMALFGLVGAAVGLFIYRRTMARAAEIERLDDPEGSAANASAAAPGVYADGPLDAAEDAPLMDPPDDDADVAALMDDDDISLWAADHFADGDGLDPDAASTAAAPTASSRRTSGTYHDDSDGDRTPAKKR